MRSDPPKGIAKADHIPRLDGLVDQDDDPRQQGRHDLAAGNQAPTPSPRQNRKAGRSIPTALTPIKNAIAIEGQLPPLVTRQHPCIEGLMSCVLADRGQRWSD